jgi:ubiquinone/menaquinone biosynthesis C-methylase UbiE
VRDSIACAYDRWSQVYDVDANATRDLDALVLRAQTGEFTGRDVLELGCGTGKNTEWLALYARQILALDFSEGMLARARARLSDAQRVSFLLHDVRQPWPVEEASRDRVVSNLVLEHVEDLRPIFVQATRALRTGGCFLLSELHPFRQLQGAGASFVRPEDAQVEPVRAFLHDVADYVSAGFAAGLDLRALEEWRDAEAPRSSVPRLLTMTWQKPARAAVHAVGGSG